MLDHARHTLTQLRDELRQHFVERDDVIDGMLTATLAGEHILLLGPVGTAKSMLANALCERLQDAHFFGWLLTKFSTPEELFGPISLQSLEHDTYRRVTTQRLPEAHVAFLDEIFKANSAILNTLLSIMNERVFHDGQHARRVPLISLISASNELPDEGELLALFDRFLVRFVVDYIHDDDLFLAMLQSQHAPPQHTLSLEALQTLRAHTTAIPIPEGILHDLVNLRRQLNAQDIVASDRRYRQALNLLRAHALLNGRDRVITDDLFILEHVLWNDPDQRATLRTHLHNLARSLDDDARALLTQAHDIDAYAQRTWDHAEAAMRASIEAHTKLKNVLARAEALLDNARARERSTDVITHVVETIQTIQRDILARSLQV